MAGRPKKKTIALTVDTTEQPLTEVVEISQEAPTKEECKNCRYWHRQMNSDYGLCKRRIIGIISGSSLTEYGLSGKFAVMPSTEYCGEFEFKKPS